VDHSLYAGALLDEAITDIRNRGHTREHATVLAARLFGLPLRRVVRLALCGGRETRVLDAERDRLRAAFLLHLDEEAAHLEARAAAARERYRRMLAGEP
jgi:hypothetical protein